MTIAALTKENAIFALEDAIQEAIDAGASEDDVLQAVDYVLQEGNRDY